MLFKLPGIAAGTMQAYDQRIRGRIFMVCRRKVHYITAAQAVHVYCGLKIPRRRRGVLLHPPASCEMPSNNVPDITLMIVFICMLYC